MEFTEAERVRALESCGVMDTGPDGRFDRIVELAADLFDTPMAAIGLIDDRRYWMKAAVGLELGEMPRHDTLCDVALAGGAGTSLMVPDARQDGRLMGLPPVKGAPGVRFYAGAVVSTVAGVPIGTLCVLAPEPRAPLTERELRRLRHLAALVSDELELGAAMRGLQERSALLDMAEAMSGLGHFRYATADGRITWSDEVYRIHGVSRETFDPNLDQAIGFYHEDDQAAVNRAVADVIDLKQDYNFQLRLRRADGDLRFVKSTGTAELDSRGKVAAVFGVFQDVTDQARHIEAVERSEYRYRLLADHMADVVTRIRPDGSGSYISPGIEGLIGWTPAQMQGQTVQDFVTPADRPLILQALQQIANGADRQTVEHRARHKSGHDIWVETRFQPIPAQDGRPFEIIAVIRDIGERKAAEAALADSETRYGFMVENANDMIARMKRGGEITLVTAGCQRVLGYSPSELVGRTTLELMHPDDLAMVHDYFTRLEALGPGGILAPYQFRGRHRDGHYVWLEGQPRLFFDGDDTRHTEVQDVVRDISTRKALELNLARARAEAESATAAKAEFLANMSHEIRTPLHGVLGFAKALAQTPLDPAQAGYVERIRRAGAGLGALVDDILDFSKLEAGKVEIAAAPFDLRELAEEAMTLIEAGMTRPLAFLLDCDPAVARWISGDAQRIRQVLLNLLGNAAKFTPAGSVRLSIVIEDQTLVLRIVDTGIGISPERVPTVFEGFVQADASIGKTYGGSGLGLGISRGLARRMGGDIALSSVQGIGTTVTFTLPYEPRETPDDIAVPKPAATNGQPSLAILVVDDVEANQDLMQLTLGAAGHHVVVAGSGHESLERLETGEKFDLVLMDVQMPGLDGFETTRRIKRLAGSNADIPVVALSANVMASHRASATAAGMNGYLGKPLDLDALNAILATVARQGRPVPVPTPHSDPLEAIRDRYRIHLAGVAQEVATIQAMPVAMQRKALCDLTHRLTGASGSLGFTAVSRAAALLESRLMARDAPELDAAGTAALEALLDETRLASQAAASTAPFAVNG